MTVSVSMEFSQELRQALEVCRMKSLSFSVACPPGADAPEFYACDEPRALMSLDSSGVTDGFVVAKFGAEKAQAPVLIEKRYTIAELLQNDGCQSKGMEESVEESCTSTPREAYETNLQKIICDLDGKMEKVVISRRIAIDSNRLPVEVAEDYFNAYPDCFRAFYHIPDCGTWIVATPEILLNYNYKSHAIETMSLAGTRKLGGAEWDRKNVMEHCLVTDYIVSMLRKHGLVCKVDEMTGLRFGMIEHLCNRIVGTGEIDPIELALDMSPTPAVCGWPVKEAFRIISAVEGDNRGCYGGFIGMTDADSCRLFVNLRSCKVVPSDAGCRNRYILYAGGGINYMSVPSEEWEEAESKIATLKNIIQKDCETFIV